MKLRILSDLHLEGNYFKYEYLGEDMVVLAGDIHTKGNHDKLLEQIFEQANIPVLLVAGNHEFYHGEFNKVKRQFKIIEGDYPNFHFLDNSSFEYEGISFFGGTMYSDFKLYGPSGIWFAEQDARRYVRDFSACYKENQYYELDLWTTEDHVEEYKHFNREFDRWVKDAEGKTRVCISHFMPSEKSIAPQYGNSNLNPYFASNNEDRVQLVDLWIAGHTHSSVDIKIGETRLVINPKGYGKENPNFNPNLIIDL